VSRLLLPNVVGRALPFHCTAAPDAKLVPNTLSVNAAPAVTVEGDKEVMTGGGTMGNTAGAEPVDGGLITVISATPPEAISVAGIDAVICALLTNVVTRLPPFHCTIAPDAKFEPLTVSTNAWPPWLALDGESEVIIGVKLLLLLPVELCDPHADWRIARARTESRIKRGHGSDFPASRRY